MILICISFMISDVEHLSMCLLIGYLYIFGEMSIPVLCPFLNQVDWFLLLRQSIIFTSVLQD